MPTTCSAILQLHVDFFRSSRYPQPVSRIFSRFLTSLQLDGEFHFRVLTRTCTARFIDPDPSGASCLKAHVLHARRPLHCRRLHACIPVEHALHFMEGREYSHARTSSGDARMSSCLLGSSLPLCTCPEPMLEHLQIWMV